MKNELKLYVSPGSCARVPTIAMEEIGLPFETELVRFYLKQQKSADYLAVNPKGKVPALLINDEVLTENVAILTWLHRTYPEGKLFPRVVNDLQTVNQIGDLAFFSGTIHPFISRFARPEKFITDKNIRDQVSDAAAEGVKLYWSQINDRLAGGPWWYGEDWSIVDGYLFWAWWRMGVAGYDGNAFANIQAHAERIQERPSVERAMQREKGYIKMLEEEGCFDSPQ